MATVVIIHAAEDTLPARALAEKLRQAKLTVTLEHAPGEPLREAVRNAQVTVALWSPRTVEHPGIVEEVQAARGKTKVVHALMQSAAMPDQFAGEQPINLTGWRGEDDFQPWRDLAKLVTAKAGVANLPSAAPKPPSGFFQPGHADASEGAPAPPRQTARPQQQPPRQQAARPQPQPAPRPQPQPAAARPQPAPRPAPHEYASPDEPRSGGRGMMMAIIVLIVVGLVGGGGYWFMTQNQGAAQSTSLEDVDLGSAAALREFLASNPSAAEHEQAREALATLEQQSLDAARDANTIEAFEQFLGDFPESEEAVFVQGQIQQLRVLEAEAAGEAPPEAATGAPITELGPDPDLVPPGTTPDESGGPVPLTPPPTEPPPAQQEGPTP